MAMVSSNVAAAVGLASERRSIPRANRHLDRELDVNGVFDLSC